MPRNTYIGFSVLLMVLFMGVSPGRVLALGTDITSITTRTISTTPFSISGITGNSLEARYPKMRGDSGGHVAGVGGLSAKLLILLAWGPGFEPDIEPLILFTHFAN